MDCLPGFQITSMKSATFTQQHLTWRWFSLCAGLGGAVSPRSAPGAQAAANSSVVSSHDVFDASASSQEQKN